MLTVNFYFRLTLYILLQNVRVMSDCDTVTIICLKILLQIIYSLRPSILAQNLYDINDASVDVHYVHTLLKLKSRSQA